MAYSPCSTPLQDWGTCHAGGAHGGHHNYGKQCNPVLGTLDGAQALFCSFCGKTLLVILPGVSHLGEVPDIRDFI